MAHGSSHREAPGILATPFADNTDVYAFISPEDPDKIVFVANYVPLLLPNSGPNFYRFGDEVEYGIHIDNDGDAIRDVSYWFRFRSAIRNGDTFLYNTGPVDSLDDTDLNVRQFYSVHRENAGAKSIELADDVPVAPWNAGPRSFPDYDGVANEAIQPLAGGRVFAGPRDEPFFVDLQVFDLLGVGGESSTDGLNVMSLVLEVPIEDVVDGGVRPDAGTTGPNSVLGIYASAYQRRNRVHHLRRRTTRHFGRRVQVSRLAFPLINEAVIPLKDKDEYNRSLPQDDVERFGQYILDPELNGLLTAVLGLPCTPTPEGGRTDIVDLLSPNGTTPADLLRININAGQTFADSGFPNGRKLDDDVVDTILTIVCNGPLTVGDGVDGNDVEFSGIFPFLASPHPQPRSSPDADGDGSTVADGDCDDTDPTVKPGAAEICDGVDNDCNGVVDDAVDGDSDLSTLCTDCDDADDMVFPGATELCDGKDNDCDEEIDEGCDASTTGRAVLLDDDLDPSVPIEPYVIGSLLCLDQITAGGCIFFAEGDCVDDLGVSQPHLHGFIEVAGLVGPFGGFYQEFNDVCGFGDIIDDVPGCGPDLLLPCGATAQ